MGIKTVAVYSQAEPLARHVQLADEAYCIGNSLFFDVVKVFQSLYLFALKN